MRPEKNTIVEDIVSWLNRSPFMIVVDFKGLTVSRFSELRSRLAGAGSHCHVVKNSLLKIASREVGNPDCADILAGQTAIVFGEEDASAAAKVLKSFYAEFNVPAVKGGVIDKNTLDSEQIKALADLPSKDVLRAQLLGLLQTPATRFVRVLNEPGASLARLLNAYKDKLGEA